jgi:hypothetical protein
MKSLNLMFDWYRRVFRGGSESVIDWNKVLDDLLEQEKKEFRNRYKGNTPEE